MPSACDKTCFIYIYGFYVRKHREDSFRQKQLSYAVLPKEQYPQIKKSWLAVGLFLEAWEVVTESLSSSSETIKKYSHRSDNQQKQITNTLANSEVEGQNSVTLPSF